MGLKDLDGKRTGRPQGSKSNPAWVRAVRWAEQNLGKPDAEPPSTLAGLLLTLGREHPDRLVACLALVDPLVPVAGEQDRGGNSAPPSGADGKAGEFRDDRRPRRLKEVTVREASLFSWLRAGEPGTWVHNPPRDAHMVACEADVSQRAIRLIIRSEEFPDVAAGEPIPELEREIASGW